MSQTTDDIPSIISHISVGTNKLEDALNFYDRVLATIGASRQEEVPEIAVAYGKRFPEFWVQIPYNQKPAQVANGVHFAFIAPSEEAVHAFYDTAIELGAICDGKPGPRPEYGAPYYGCFVRDLDGHKIEAAFWDESKM
ncbi:lactoylglutathione lyase [Vibrio astriarenae]|uniref:VOC family protein n=1 Tax=Vibrio astriarenae TaxID=1481923 RepID=UPI000505AC16|nr:lactoylglutathione lyase [Vibrio sp. C7]